MGKPNERSALFLDRAYIDRKFAELRADMITVMEAKFRAIQNNQDKLIGLLENREAHPVTETEVNDKEGMDWKLEMSSRVKKDSQGLSRIIPNFQQCSNSCIS